MSPRAIPSGSKIINKNITLVTASSNAYNYPQIVLPLGRYVIYATEHGNGDEVLGTSAPFTVLNGANPTCLNSTDIEPDPAGADGGGGSSSGASGGTIAGVVIGAIVGTLILAFVAFWFWRKRQRKSLWLSQSSRRMFDGRDREAGWKGIFSSALGGRSKRDSQRSSARGFNNEQEISGPMGVITPASTTSSNWRSPTEVAGQTRPSDEVEGKGSGDEEKYGMGVFNPTSAAQRGDDRGIELTRLQPGAPLDTGVGLNIPVLNKGQNQDVPRRLSRAGLPPPSSYDNSGSTAGSSTSPSSTTSPSQSWNAHSYPFDPERDERERDRAYHPDDYTLSTPSSGRHPAVTGLQRNASVASTTLGSGAGIGRSLSNKRHSTGLASSMKRKPVPTMSDGSPTMEGRPPRLDDFGRGEGTEEMLSEQKAGKSHGGPQHDGMSRQSSAGSLAVSTSEATIRPGQGRENNSRRSSFLLMPDKPLDQED
jgi:hypothetical protein